MTNRAPEHLHLVRVYYEDTDAGGVVYYSNYLGFAERARAELLRDSGIDQRTLLAKRGLMFAVRRCEAEYLKPGRLDDMLEVYSRCLEVKGASFLLEQLVKCTGETLVEMKVRLVCMKVDGRPTRLPEKLRKSLDGLLHAR
ncbi:MAG: Acyl-CoA thioester hydrolase YbgC [Alphaproteobacteria bacterium MarineAlpha11_Bin1]|nr:MAG: Acyl-CoA thioester hydrolase YbgC [Alphaproteobacteria bacterium MarineAlpha11_Bin1]|tara:strand:+ start:11330 stop:11752 length:423 start_codon:yes stop_codon:yes gene_type:complete